MPLLLLLACAQIDGGRPVETRSGRAVETRAGGPAETHRDRDRTLNLVLSGDLRLDIVFRDGELVDGRGAGDEDALTMEGDVRVRLDVELSDDIRATLSFRNRRLNGGLTNSFGENPESTGVLFDEASVTIDKFLTPELKATGGIVPVSFDLRGRGSAFFFDPAHSNSLARNAGPSGVTSIGGADRLQPTGGHGLYVTEDISLGAFLLPAILESGRASDDEGAYGLWFMVPLDSLGPGSRAGGIGTIGWFAGRHTSLFTVGGGLDWHAGAFELYAEAYFQLGDAGDDVKARGWALQTGGQVTFPSENDFWVAVNLTWVSGDDDAGDRVNRNFLSYENVNDLKILEDAGFGLDLDTNYLSFKIGGGLSLPVGSKLNLEIHTLLGLNRLARDVGGGDGAFSEAGLASGGNRIGHEWDLGLRLAVTSQLSLTAGVALLFGSDLLEESGTEDDERAFLGWLGADLKF